MIGDRWGVTWPEIRRRYPCDDLIADPVLEAWRGVTVRARPERVWPWVTQNGWRRTPTTGSTILDADHLSGYADYPSRSSGSPACRAT